MTPFALWARVLLKGGEAVLDTMDAAVKARRRPQVAVLPSEDAPRQHAAPIQARKPAPRKARGKVKAKAKPKRKVRARSAKASARRR